VEDDIIVLDNAFRGVESKTDDITTIVDERKAEFNTKFDAAVQDIKQEFLDQVTAFTP